MRAWRRAAWSLLVLAVLLAAAMVALDRWVAATELPPLEVETSVEVLARDGRLLRAFTVADGRWRLAVDPARVDPGYLAMLLAYEDHRFYRHAGVDPWALARAGFLSVRYGRRVAGGSTLTMQVARLLEDGATGTWRGKLRQMRVALALERVRSKEQILALYLQLAPMGGNLEGVRAGSIAWFGEEPERLTEAEAALLVALPQAPTTRMPDEHPEAAREARDRVLARAAAAGVITEEAAAAATREALPTTRRPFPTSAPHVADRLRAAHPDVPVHRTTLDAELQAALEALATSALVDLPAPATLALLVADPDSGAILASVGSADDTSDARRGFVDMTQALRSPGSTLKPLVYGLAFSDGLAHPETLLNDRPEDYGGYAPQNFDGVFRGPVTAREALQASLNLPVVALTEALGPARLLAAMRQAGVEAVVPGDAPGLAVALGGVGVSLEGLVQLYAAIARGGEARGLSVVPGGSGLPAGSRLMTPEAAWHVADVLAEAPRPAGSPDAPLAFKTGTSSGHRDALALGFDGAHVVGVWVGRADGTPVPGMYGVEVAAPVLFEVFARLGGTVALPPAPPGVLEVASNAALPEPLRQFGARTVVVEDAPRLTFPPDGSALVPLPGGVPARVERGTAPFTWFADGAPVVVGSYERESRLELPGPGFVTVSVVDAEGRGARVRVEVR
ncbi:MAG: penicillin-binding protein 1C [Trueperaceae bacterium]|nr:penicillin-binding protein 1C [Trueperaceae bacterium]